MDVRVGQTQTLKVQNQSVRGVKLVAYLTHTTLNTAFAVHGVDWSQLIVSVKLHRNREVHTIYQDNAEPGLLASTYFKPAFKYVHPQLDSNFVTLVTQTVSLYHVIMLPVYLDFGSIVNLKNDDRLEVKLQLNSDAFASTIDTANSYIQFNEIVDIGNEFFIPKIQTWSIQPNQNKFQESLGSSVVSSYFINTDKSDRTIASQVLTQLSVTSDKYSDDVDYTDLLCGAINQFDTPAEAALRYQCFNLFSEDIILDDAQLNITLDSANINAGKNYIVAFSGEVDKITMSRAIQRQQKHLAENVRALENKLR